MLVRNTQIGSLQIVIIDHPLYGEMQIEIEVNGKATIYSDSGYLTTVVRPLEMKTSLPVPINNKPFGIDADPNDSRN